MFVGIGHQVFDLSADKDHLAYSTSEAAGGGCVPSKYQQVDFRVKLIFLLGLSFRWFFSIHTFLKCEISSFPNCGANFPRTIRVTDRRWWAGGGAMMRRESGHERNKWEIKQQNCRCTLYDVSQADSYWLILDHFRLPMTRWNKFKSDDS